uniref:Uncharacterized protein n=1 Tax=Trypanosoma vivax (strain Y486) TaxID=1055687 RepID=G0TUF6_TRYVY|nr:conserved hypothetical protein [Trypanosoma vivax Y486]
MVIAGTRPRLRYASPSFLRSIMRGRRNRAVYYSERGGAEGHPDALAEVFSAGRPDTEWMWVQRLCFVCTASTVGTWLWQTYFYKHAEYFKDEPWSPFRN